ncbi:hypothetical protein [Thiocystis violacea]|uniref:hypothetical protein n=1 Tax=Thiocystis violacea TaxID=13725 RepID=UPI001907BBCE|nr:hypothetical protein [Thiocystis violacea]
MTSLYEQDFHAWSNEQVSLPRAGKLSKEQGIRLASHLAGNPSLESKLDEAILPAYRLAAIEAERETGLFGVELSKRRPLFVRATDG